MQFLNLNLQWQFFSHYLNDSALEILKIKMNFKSLIFIAGAVALASAQESSENLAEESPSMEAAQVECHPGYNRCARCFGAAAKKARRYRAIVNWRNSQNKANVKVYYARLAYRNKQVKYWSSTWYRAQYKTYLARRNYTNKRYSQLVGQANRYYANCQ